MKKYNENLLKATQKMSKETLDKSMNTVNKLTHPSKKVATIGSTIGKTVGVGLIIAGSVGVFLGNVWGVESIVAGITTLASNASA
jgi:hypothetical protein